MTHHKSVIVDAVRSPIGMKKSPLLQVRPDELTALLLKALLERNPGLDPTDIEDVLIGCAFPEAIQGMLVARGIAALAGLPIEVGASVTNRFCGSSMDTVHQASRAIELGEYPAALAGGVEDMFRVPMGGYNPSFQKDLFEKKMYINMGDTAENLAQELDISREDQEAFAVESHRKALDAIEKGRFNNEIIPVPLPGAPMDRDEGPREPDLEKIRSLKPAFSEKGTITAATSSPVSFGAAALLVTSEEYAKEKGLKVRAEIISRAVAGVEWTHMGRGPLPATEKALKRAGMQLNDIDVIELNEAFSSQSLYVIRKGAWPMDRINQNGGAIALGHPLGASGSRILATLINVMEQQDKETGLATMCIGTGQGIATIIRRR